MLCSSKDSYKAICPDCNKDYVGKTGPNLVMKLNEHDSREDQPMYQHLPKSEHFPHLIDLIRWPTSETEINNKKDFLKLVIVVLSNVFILNACCNWSQLLLLEALNIKNLALENKWLLERDTRACFISIEPRLA